MRCPQCGAANTDSAAWCSQCYARFESTPEQPPGDADDAVVDRGQPGEQSGVRSDAGTGATGRGAAGAVDRDVRERDGALEWRCRTCRAWTPFETEQCVRCGAPRQGFLPEPAGTRPTPAVPAAGRLIAASVALPGLGHVLARRSATGVARAVLALLWLGGGIGLVLAGQGGLARLPGFVLLLGAGVLWAGTVLDVSELASGGRRELLTTRVLLWLVVAVTSLLLVALMGATLAGIQRP